MTICMLMSECFVSLWMISDFTSNSSSVCYFPLVSLLFPLVSVCSWSRFLKPREMWKSFTHVERFSAQVDAPSPPRANSHLLAPTEIFSLALCAPCKIPLTFSPNKPLGGFLPVRSAFSSQAMQLVKLKVPCGVLFTFSLSHQNTLWGFLRHNKRVECISFFRTLLQNQPLNILKPMKFTSVFTSPRTLLPLCLLLVHCHISWCYCHQLSISGTAWNWVFALLACTTCFTLLSSGVGWNV